MNPIWTEKNLGTITVLKAENLLSEDFIEHCFTLRNGGFSPPPFDSLNLGLHVGDSQENVIKNRRLICESLGVDFENITCAEQVHGSRVALATKSELGRGSISHISAIGGTDALITRTPNAVLMMFFADCVPIFIVDTKNRAVGLAHAGWRGTILGITAETLGAMEREFGTNPSECKAAIGPAIGQCCFEISEEIAEKISKTMESSCIKRQSNGSPHADLKLANKIGLERAGVPPSNIAVSECCTCCNKDKFFSYRRDIRTGRMAAIIAIKAAD